MKYWKNQPEYKVGDWVALDGDPGIWRVDRIIDGIFVLRFDLNARKPNKKRQVVSCKRFLDARWRPKFAFDCSDGALIKALTEADRHRLEHHLANAPEDLAAFELYKPVAPGFICNYDMFIPEGVNPDDAKRQVKELFYDIGDRGLTNEEVLVRLNTSRVQRYRTRGHKNSLMQFHCNQYETRDQEFVFREVELVMMPGSTPDSSAISPACA